MQLPCKGNKGWINLKFQTQRFLWHGLSGNDQKSQFFLQHFKGTFIVSSMQFQLRRFQRDLFLSMPKKRDASKKWAKDLSFLASTYNVIIGHTNIFICTLFFCPLFWQFPCLLCVICVLFDWTQTLKMNLWQTQFHINIDINFVRVKNWWRLLACYDQLYIWSIFFFW